MISTNIQIIYLPRIYFQTFVAIHNDLIQKQEKYFKSPDKFLPERWLRGDDQEISHPFAALPFGFGSRSCLGRRFAEQEVSLALIKVRTMAMLSEIQQWLIPYLH